MHRRFPPLTLIAFATSSAAGLAQVPVPPNYATETHSVQVDKLGIPGYLELSGGCAEELNGDGLRDLVFRAGNSIHIAWNAGLTTALDSIMSSTSLSTFTCLPPLPGVSQGRVVSIESGSMKAWSLSKVSGLWSSAPVPSTPDPAWHGATTVTASDLNADGFADLVGGSGNTVLVTYGDQTGGFGATTSFQLPAPQVIKRVIAGDLDLDGIQEIGIESATGFAVRTVTGVPLQFMRNRLPVGAVAVIHRDTNGRSPVADQFVWITRANDTVNEILYVVDSIGWTAPVSLGVFHSTAAKAADVNGDGYDDLLVGGGDGATHRLLINVETSGSGHYGIGSPSYDFSITGLSAAGSSQPAEAVLRDLDGDDTADVLAFDPQTRKWSMRAAFPVINNPLAGPTTTCEEGSLPFFHALYRVVYTSPDGTVFDFDPDAGAQTTPLLEDYELRLYANKEAWAGWTGPTAANAIEVTVWKRLPPPSNDGNQGPALTASAMGRYVFFVTDTAANNVHNINPRYLSGLSTVEYQIEIPLTSTPGASNDHGTEMPVMPFQGSSNFRFYLQMRACTATASGETSNFKRTYVAGVACHNPYEAGAANTVNLLMGDPGNVHDSIPFNDPCIYASSSVKLGGFVALSALPDFPIGVVPMEGAVVHVIGNL